MKLSLSLKHVSQTNIKPSAAHENSSGLDHIPLDDTPPPTLSAQPHAHMKYQIACSSYWIMNVPASAYHCLQQSAWGTGRDVRGLQAKHKIEDKLELIICLFLYMCFKIKCKLNKVITELGRVGGGFLLQTADTSTLLSLTSLNVICKCALRMSSCGNVFRKNQKWMENNSMKPWKKRNETFYIKLIVLSTIF